MSHASEKLADAKRRVEQCLVFRAEEGDGEARILFAPDGTPQVLIFRRSKMAGDLVMFSETDALRLAAWITDVVGEARVEAGP